MSKHRRIGLGTLLAMAVGAGLPTACAHPISDEAIHRPETVASGEYDDVFISDSLRLREQYGLDSHPSTLAQLARDGESSEAYGILMTQEEEALLRTREETFLENFEALKESLPVDEVAGIWLDHQAGGATVVALVPTASELDESDQQERARNLAPHPESLTFVTASYSEEELLTLKRSIWADRQHLLGQGINIVQASLDTKGNGIVISVERASQEILSLLQREYPHPAVRFKIADDGELEDDSEANDSSPFTAE